MSDQLVSERVLKLLDQAFDGLASQSTSLTEVIGIAIRIARLRGDFDSLQWLELEQRLDRSPPNKARQMLSGVKAGGHPASSASMVAIMTALLRAPQRGRPRLGQAPRGPGRAGAIWGMLGLQPR